MTGLTLPTARLTALLVSMALGAASPTAQAATKLTVPDPISSMYSTADMHLDLAITPGIETPCVEEECDLNRAFDTKVSQLGARIAAAAYKADPELKHRVKNFEFSVAEKKGVGLTSNATGKIVVLRGTQQIGLNDQALAFVLAREMGHVISQHHAVNTTTRVLLSVAAGLLFPALNLFGNSAAIAQTTSATASSATVTAAMATTAASTATSYLGARLLMNRLKPEQLKEADQVALNLMGNMGWSHHDIATALENSAEFEPSNAWSHELRYSITQIMALETVGGNASAPPSSNPENATDHAEGSAVVESLVDAQGLLLPPLQEPVTEAEAAVPAPVETASEKVAEPVPRQLPLTLTIAPVTVLEPIANSPRMMATRSTTAWKIVSRRSDPASNPVHLNLSRKLTGKAAIKGVNRGSATRRTQPARAHANIKQPGNKSSPAAKSRKADASASVPSSAQKSRIAIQSGSRLRPAAPAPRPRPG